MKGLVETMETECVVSSKAFRPEDTSALLLDEEPLLEMSHSVHAINFTKI